MTGLTADMVTALGQPSVVMFGAVEILLPSYSLRLVDGPAVLSFGGHSFVGRDATYGVLGAVSSYTDGVDNNAPSLTVTLFPPGNAAMAALAAPTAQGSQVSIWVGCVDTATGLVVDAPDLCFIGELDFATQNVDLNTRSLDLAVVSIFDRFFDQDEGARLNNGFWKSVWSTDAGLEFVSQVQRQLPWGSDAPRPSYVNVPQTVDPGSYIPW